MGDSETGGDGSVQWKVEVDRVRRRPNGDPEVRNESKGPLGHHQSGIDEDGADGEIMTVSIEAPRTSNAPAFLAYLTGGGLQVDGNRVYFNLRIEEHNDNQVRLSWGGSYFKKVNPAPL